MKEKVIRTFNILSFVTIFLAFVLLMVVFYWLFHTYNPLEVKSVTTNKINYKVGDLLVTNIDRCKNLSLSATIDRQFVDSLVFSTPEIVADNPAGCYVFASSLTIPESLPTGDYELRTVYKYQVNPIRTVTVTTLSNKFHVTGKDEK